MKLQRSTHVTIQLSMAYTATGLQFTTIWYCVRKLEKTGKNQENRASRDTVS